MKTFNKIKNGCLFIVTCFGLAAALPAKAGLSYQQDTNNLVVASTNTFSLYGDLSGSFTNGQLAAGNSYIDCSKGDDAWVAYGGFFTNSTANASNVTFRVAQTVDFKLWTNSAAVLVLPIPGNTTNWVVGHTLIQNAAPGYGIRAIENPSAAAVTGAPNTLFLKVYTKNGI